MPFIAVASVFLITALGKDANCPRRTTTLSASIPRKQWRVGGQSSSLSLGKIRLLGRRMRGKCPEGRAERGKVAIKKELWNKKLCRT